MQMKLGQMAKPELPWLNQRHWRGQENLFCSGRLGLVLQLVNLAQLPVETASEN
jgi:hypothetical protein